MKIARFEYNYFGVNTYIVWSEPSMEAAVIDPGMMREDERQQFDRFVADHKLDVSQLINTHLHIDHILGDSYVSHRYDVQLQASPADAFFGEDADGQVKMFRLPIKDMQPVRIYRELQDGDVIRIGDEELKVIATPGHSPGSISLYNAKDGWVITGDTLFNSSVGRTDLPGGNPAELLQSITGRLLTLPESTVVYPGHGPATTIGAEEYQNPYLRMHTRR